MENEQGSKEKVTRDPRKIERKILGLTLRDRITNEWIPQRTRVDDIGEVSGRNKCRWAGHVTRLTD